MSYEFTIRRGTLADIPAMQRLFVETISTVCARHYDSHQIKAWTEGAENPARWQKLVEEQFLLIATLASELVGFGSLRGGDYVDVLYVSARHQGRGIARKILGALETEAVKNKTPKLTADVSLSAEPFFLKSGFLIVKRQVVVRSGVELPNAQMEKQLVSAQRKSYVSESDYLAIERTAILKSELIDGQVVAMAGATLTHNEIVSNLFGNLKLFLKGKTCRVYSSDLRVKLGLGSGFVYPDLTIVCSKPEMLDDQFDTLTNPTVIVEVMSKSTEEKDRGTKFFNYRQIPSLKEYLLISSTELFVQMAIRQADGSWKFDEIADLQKSMPITAIGHQVALAEIYENVEF